VLIRGEAGRVSSSCLGYSASLAGWERSGAVGWGESAKDLRRIEDSQLSYRLGKVHNLLLFTLKDMLIALDISWLQQSVISY